MPMPAQPPMDADVVKKLDELATAVETHADPVQTDPYDDAVLAATFGLIELAKTHEAGLRDLQKTIRKASRGR